MLNERGLVIGVGRYAAVLESRPVLVVFARLHGSRGVVLSSQLNYVMVRSSRHSGETVELLLNYLIPRWWPRSAQHHFRVFVVPLYEYLALNDEELRL